MIGMDVLSGRLFSYCNGIKRPKVMPETQFHVVYFRWCEWCNKVDGLVQEKRDSSTLATRLSYVFTHRCINSTADE